MALYKYREYMEHSEDQAFDRVLAHSVAAPWPGIYRCPGCGREIGIAQGHVLPPQNHHQHRPEQGAVRWQLVASHKAY